MDSPLIMTPSIESMIYSNFAPKNPEKGGYLLAGLGENGSWQSNTGTGGNSLYTLLMGMDIYKEVFTVPDARVIPWFQYTGKEFDGPFHEFMEQSIRPYFMDVLILMPQGKSYGIRHFSKDMEPQELLVARYIEDEADSHIRDLMDAFIRCRPPRFRKSLSEKKSRRNNKTLQECLSN